ncbi:unnamed protein product [Ambrosiozyma monospora]|uniref:Unnamed protein product n=1 Tax=Ambrosiozyma monospora TaxID=43982 RepID=A0ACB5T750_AMBMO|nr:unnamed protein product [Ambrosiozyma monospora]
MADFLQRRKLNDANVKESLYSDLNKITSLKTKEELSEEELKKIADLKAKYGISSWEEGFENKELFNSDVTYLTSKIQGLQMDVKVTEKVKEIMENESSPLFVTISEKMGITNETKKNIKKNLVRKFLKVTPKEELSGLGITL